MDKSTIEIIPTLVTKGKTLRDTGFNFGPFVTANYTKENIWNISFMAYFLSHFDGFEQPKGNGIPYMYENLLPLQKVFITPENPNRFALEDNSLFNLWQFNLKIQKDRQCQGIHLEIDLHLVFENEPTRGTVVMGETPM